MIFFINAGDPARPSCADDILACVRGASNMTMSPSDLVKTKTRSMTSRICFALNQATMACSCSDNPQQRLADKKVDLSRGTLHQFHGGIFTRQVEHGL